jgi:hypothetical protein
MLTGKAARFDDDEEDLWDVLTVPAFRQEFIELLLEWGSSLPLGRSHG